MRAVCYSAEDRADNDERRCHNQPALAAKSVAQDTDNDLPDDVPCVSTSGSVQASWKMVILAYKQGVRNTGGDCRRVFIGI